MNTTLIPCDPAATPRPTTVPTSDPGPWAECSPLAHGSSWADDPDNVPVPTAPPTTAAPAPEPTAATAVITGPVTPFSAAPTVETTAYTTAPPPSPPALPQTGQASTGIVIAAALAVIAGALTRRAARRPS